MCVYTLVAHSLVRPSLLRVAMDRSALARVAAVPESLSRHPYVSLCVVTGLLLTASWLLKRARVRIPARQIDLYRYTPALNRHRPAPAPH